MLYSGIDLRERTLVIHTLDADGTTTREICEGHPLCRRRVATAVY